MKARSAFILTALLLVGSSAAAKGPVEWPTGLYSNVRMSAETGDLGGMEANFYEDAGKHMVEFVWCEGWCNITHKAEVTRADSGFIFKYVEIYEGGEGRTETDMRLVVRPKGKDRISISAWQGSELLDYDGKPQILKRAKQPFGISVANGNGEQDN